MSEGARLERRDRWTMYAGAALLARVLCGHRDRHGAQTCTQTLGWVSWYPPVVVFQLLPYLRALEQDAPGAGVDDLGEPYMLLEPGWHEVGGIWSLTADARRRMRIHGEAAPRRMGAIIRRASLYLDLAEGRAPDITAAQASRLGQREGRAPSLLSLLPLTVLSPCGARQLVTRETLERGGLYQVSE